LILNQKPHWPSLLEQVLYACSGQFTTHTHTHTHTHTDRYIYIYIYIYI